MPKRPASEMLETLREMAEDLFGDDDEQKESYVKTHMQKLGYKARVIFEDADDSDDSKGGDFVTGLFGGNRERRTVEGGRRRPAAGEYRG